MLQGQRELSELLLLQRIIKVEDEKLYLENGTTLSFTMKEDDGASADIYWLAPENFEGLITSIEYEHKYDWSHNNSEVTITLYHNQNEVAQAEAYARTRNYGYYFSVVEVNVETVNGKDVFTLLDSDDGQDFKQTDDESNTYVDRNQAMLDNDLLKTLTDDVEVTK